MEENQTPKKRNYERYLEGQNMWDAQSSPYNAPEYTETAYSESTEANYTPSQNSYNAGYSQPDMSQSYAGLEEPVSKGEWAVCFLLMMIPCVGVIMMFVWAFSSSEKKSKSNFFKVQLIFVGVVFVLYFLLFLVAMIAGIAIGA